MKDHPINIIISIYCKHFYLVLQNEVENFANNNSDIEKIADKKIIYSEEVSFDLTTFERVERDITAEPPFFSLKVVIHIVRQSGMYSATNL